MAETVRIEIPIETIDETEPELTNLIKKLGKAGKETDKLGESADRAKKKVSKFDEAAEKRREALQNGQKRNMRYTWKQRRWLPRYCSRWGTGSRA